MSPPSAVRELDPARLITVVSGLPRSGTSMMIQMLEAAGLEIASDDLRTADADNPRGYYELEAVKRIREDAAFLGDCVGKVVKVVAPLLRFLPSECDYRVVFMERDLGEVLASQREMLARRGEESDVASDAMLERAYRNQVEKIEGWLGERSNVRTVFVSHRKVVEKPREEARRVAEFLELNGDGRRMADPSTSVDSSVDGMVRAVDRSLVRHRVRGR